MKKKKNQSRLRQDHDGLREGNWTFGLNFRLASTLASKAKVDPTS